MIERSSTLHPCRRRAPNGRMRSNWTPRDGNGSSKPWMRPCGAAQNTSQLRQRRVGANRDNPTPMTGTPQPRDLKLRACMKAFKWDEEFVELSADEVRPVAEAYSRNVRRVYSLVLFPPAAVNMAITIQH